MLCAVAQLCSWWEEHRVAGRTLNHLIHRGYSASAADSAALVSQLPQWLLAENLNHIIAVCVC
jgi:hypothetical protein